MVVTNSLEMRVFSKYCEKYGVVGLVYSVLFIHNCQHDSSPITQQSLLVLLFYREPIQL